MCTVIEGFKMEICYYTNSSQNISHKGFLNKFFLKGGNKLEKTPIKDEIIENFSKDLSGNSIKNKLNRLFTLLQTDYHYGESFQQDVDEALKLLEKEEKNKTIVFFQEFLNFLKKNEEKVFQDCSANGLVPIQESEQIFSTCQRLLYPVKDDNDIIIQIKKARELMKTIEETF